MVSKRSQIFLEREEFLVAKMSQCAQDLYDANVNPKGYINLGTAQNFLCEDEIAEWLKVPGNFEHKSKIYIVRKKIEKIETNNQKLKTRT